MQIKRTSAFASLIASGVLAFSTTPAQAFNFSTGTNLDTCGHLIAGISGPDTLGSNTAASCKTADGFTIEAGGLGGDEKLQVKKIDNVYGLGVSGSTGVDLVHGEVNFGEFINLVLDAPKVLKSIDLSFLYRPGVYSDAVFEAASISAGGTISGSVQVTGPNSAKWSLGGSVLNLAPSNEGKGGSYRILNPFGDLAVSKLTLTAFPQSDVSPLTSANADFALTGAEVKEVPEPGTVVGLGLVAGALVTSRRRRVRVP